MKIKTVAIFVPGYYGTTLLHEQSGKLIWGDAREVLFGNNTLALPLAGLNIPKALHLKPHTIINDKKILGGLIKEDAYDKSLQNLKKIGVDVICPLAWDWRKDPYLGILALDELVKECKLLYPGSKLFLVSHSFGSLISSYYLRYGISDFDDNQENWHGLKQFEKIILSACPFRGLMSIFRNMHYGIKFGLNHNMQTALAFSSFESSYYLLPPPGLDLVQDVEGKKHCLNLHDPKNWLENQFGLFHENCFLKNESEEIRLQFISRHLERAKLFHQKLNQLVQIKPTEKTEILYLYGLGFPTVHHGVWHPNHSQKNIFLYYPKHFKKWKLKINPNIVLGDGDSTVPDFSLKLPPFFKDLNTTEVVLSKSHLSVLQSSESLNVINNFLLPLNFTSA